MPDAITQYRFEYFDFTNIIFAVSFAIKMFDVKIKIE